MTVQLTTHQQMQAYLMLQRKASLEMEVAGLRRSRGRSTYAIVKAEYGFRGSKQKVLEQLTQAIKDMVPGIFESSRPDAATKAEGPHSIMVYRKGQLLMLPEERAAELVSELRAGRGFPQKASLAFQGYLDFLDADGMKRSIREMTLETLGVRP